jgi:hypothetical protein
MEWLSAMKAERQNRLEKLVYLSKDWTFLLSNRTFLSFSCVGRLALGMAEAILGRFDYLSDAAISKLPHRRGVEIVRTYRRDSESQKNKLGH